MRILYDNKADDATLSSSTADPNYPVSAIQDRHLSRAFRTTSGTSQTITFDMGAAVDGSCIAILNHNLTASATITLKANSSDSWAAAPVSTSITAVTRDIVHYFSEETYRYWQLQVSDASLSYIEIGRVFIGTYLEIEKTIINSYEEQWTENTVQNYSRGGQLYASRGIQYREYQLTFPLLTSTMVTSVKSMLDDVGGNKSFVADLDYTDQDNRVPMYSVFLPDWRFGHIFGGKMNLAIDIREVK